MLEITVGELITVIVMIGSCVGTIAIVVKWVNSKMERIAKLERAVFDDSGKERYVTGLHCNISSGEVLRKLDKLIDAVNLMNESQMVMLDVQIDLCEKSDMKVRLLEERKKLNARRGIV